MPLEHEVTMELLSDIAAMLRSVSRDFLPASPVTVTVVAGPPPTVRLRLPGATGPPIQDLLRQLAEAARDVTDKALPSLPLRYKVIGGSEASGIEVTVRPGAAPVYGHVLKAKLAWLRPSELMRRLRPNLPERIDL